jgi:tetratricopeptide (TPR) repeat protein
MEKRDFFISYTETDEKWAKWIAGVLEDNGYTTYLKAWDFNPGENFVLNVQEALENYKRFIAVLSAKYMESVYCQAEWSAAFTNDPNGEKGAFIPVRIEDYKPVGLFAPIIYVDLFGVDVKEAKERLLQITKNDRPRNKPGFPGTHKPKSSGQLPFNNIPYTKNPYFTGRKEILAEMENSLKPVENNPLILALCGLGAVGKTQIALAYAINNGYLYDTIWWVNAENESAILNSYRNLLTQKEIIKKDITYEKNDILYSVRAWMLQNQNWLFVYDNAEKEADLTPYLPISNTGHILITTRNPHWRDVGKKIDVDVFLPDEAVEFLERFNLDGSADDAEELAGELGYLPLALDQAAAYMSENKKSYREYIDLLKKYRLEMFGEVGYESTSYKETVATTWNISLDEIDNENAKQLLRLFAFLAPDNIPKDIFTQTAEYLPEPLASDVRNELKFDKAIRDLTRYSLIKTEKDRVSIHRLLQKVIRESLGDKKVEYFQYCVTILYELFSYDQYEMETWDNCAGLMPHVQSVLTHEEKFKTETKEIAYLYAEGAAWLSHTALYEEALKWYEKALAIREKVLGLDHPFTATTHNNIAGVYRAKGENDKAMELHEKALAIKEKFLGPDHPSTAITYNNIASVYYAKGENDKAKEWLEKALAIAKKILGPDHPSTATTYNNIAGVYSAKGENDKAMELHEKALAIREKVLGPDHPDTAVTYNRFARVYSDKGENDKALKWYKKALAIREKVPGPDHPDTAITYNNIARVYSDKGENDKAKEWFEKALAIAKKVLGPDHPFTATTYNNIAGVYSDKGENDKALELYEKALAIREKVLGPDHPDTAVTYNNIAGVYSDKGENDKAKEWFEKALAIAKKVLGPDHPFTATIYHNVAGVYHDKGENDKALEFYEKALAILEKVLGPDHPDTATTYNNIAFVYYAKGKNNKALEFYEKALAIKEKFLGPNHPDTATTYNNIAGVYYAKGEYDNALKWYEKSLAILEKVFGLDHPDTLATYMSIAILYGKQGNHKKAQEWFKKVLE